MSTTSDDEGSQEDHPQRYDIDDLEIIKTIGKSTAASIRVGVVMPACAKNFAKFSHGERSFIHEEIVPCEKVSLKIPLH